jgi:hypothetical protein
MSLHSLTTTVVPALSETHANEPAVNPYLIGVGTFVILLAMLVGLLMFGAGRDHS